MSRVSRAERRVAFASPLKLYIHTPQTAQRAYYESFAMKSKVCVCMRVIARNSHCIRRPPGRVPRRTLSRSMVLC